MFCSRFRVLSLSPVCSVHIFSFRMVSFHSQNDGSVLRRDSRFSDISGILAVRKHRRKGFCVGGNYTKSVYNQMVEIKGVSEPMSFSLAYGIEGANTLKIIVSWFVDDKNLIVLAKTQKLGRGAS